MGREELLRLLEARDRRDAATRFGLLWEANEIERDRAINSDFVALDLVPDLCVGSGPWRNLIIEGDNFDALRHLRMTYAGEVKCIYIDPPYNTGNRDFIYNDRFVDKNDSWRHSMWVEFMYQRLLLARDLLRQDGVMFISIDDNEVAPLRLLLQKVFGESNFVASFIWRKVDSPNDNKVSITPDHEYILCFARSAEAVSFRPMAAPHIVEAYGSTDTEGRRYRDRLLKKNGKNSLRRDRPTMFFPLTAPDGSDVLPIHDNGEEACWAMGREAIERHDAAKTLIWKRRVKQGREVWEPYTREYAPKTPVRPYPTIWSDLPTSRQAKAMLREVFDSADLFSTPKPVELIERLLRMCTGPDDLIVDFFGGSGTTAHAVLRQNAEDDGARRFILVSNTEATPAEPNKNLCRDICARRVRRVIEGYGDTPGLPGDFAYLRSLRISPGRLLDIEHAQVWTALQMLHLDSVAPYTGGPFLVAGGEEQLVVYIPRFSADCVPALRRAVEPCVSAVIYSWQPENLQQKIRYTHVEHAGLPEALAIRFGLRV